MLLTFLESARLSFSDHYISALLISAGFFFSPLAAPELIFILCVQHKANIHPAKSSFSLCSGQDTSRRDTRNWLSGGNQDTKQRKLQNILFQKLLGKAVGNEFPLHYNSRGGNNNELHLAKVNTCDSSVWVLRARAAELCQHSELDPSRLWGEDEDFGLISGEFLLYVSTSVKGIVVGMVWEILARTNIPAMQ